LMFISRAPYFSCCPALRAGVERGRWYT